MFAGLLFLDFFGGVLVSGGCFWFSSCLGRFGRIVDVFEILGVSWQLFDVLGVF